VAIALGVPLALSLLFVILYTTGLIRDERRADYCAVYAPVSADLSLFDNFAADLAEGRPSAVLTTTLELRQRIDALTDQPSTALIHDRLAAMTDYLRRVELAARAHDPEALAELSTRLPVFAANRQQFLNYSAEYCRYR
jgi:hypothetical protein